jgi:signal peptidase I
MSWKDIRKTAIEFGKTLVIAFLLAHFIMVSVAQAFQVEQFSMEPSLLPRDRVLVNKFIHHLRPPHPGEIVVLHPPTDASRNYIKRVIAVSGQTVQIRDGRVYVNSQPLREPYLRVDTQGDYGPAVVPASDIFVLGDNRGNSEDSRAFGFVPVRNIVGEAMVIYWPPPRFHVLMF